MMSAWWLLPAAMFGFMIGFVAHALCAAGKDNSKNEQNSS